MTTEPDVTPPTEPATRESDSRAPTSLSQGQLIRRRFFAHKPAVISLAALVLVALLGITSLGVGPIPGWWKWSPTEITPFQNNLRPTLQLWPFSLGDHPFGQHRTGRDYFAMTMRGIQNTVWSVLIIGTIATALGSVVGALAGYYRGWVDSVLMRLTDVVIVIPVLVLGALVGNSLGGGVTVLSIFLGLIIWTTLARLVRAEFLSLREREFVDAARVAGASDLRIIFKHIYPNAIGVVIVTSTLLMASAILLETALSFLGFGVKAPDISLGSLISDNSSAFVQRPWLFWWPGLFIILITLSINFIGDALRDAFDPRQSRFSVRKTKEAEPESATQTEAPQSGGVS